MSRLRNIIIEALGFGGDNSITESDISINDDGDTIIVKLINKDASLHGNKPWDDADYFYHKDDDASAIAFMNYKKEESESNDSNDSVCIIDIPYLENRPEYRKTKVFEYLMNYFLEKVVSPEENKYGKDKVFISATFANSQLERVVKRYLEKRDGAKWIDDMPEDFHAESEDERTIRTINELLSENGAEVTVPAKNVVKNFDVKTYSKLIGQCIDYEANEIDIGITANGDVVMAWYVDGYSFSYSGSEVGFVYDINNDMLMQQPGNGVNINGVSNRANAIENIKKYIGDATIYFDGKTCTADELFAEKANVANVKRLRKLYHV